MHHQIKRDIYITALGMQPSSVAPWLKHQLTFSWKTSLILFLVDAYLPHLSDLYIVISKDPLHIMFLSYSPKAKANHRRDCLLVCLQNVLFFLWAKINKLCLLAVKTASSNKINYHGSISFIATQKKSLNTVYDLIFNIKFHCPFQEKTNLSIWK